MLIFFFMLIFLEDAKRLGFLSKSVNDIFLCAKLANELIDQMQVFKLKIDSSITKLDWSDNDLEKKRKKNLNLIL